jgi:hypothetical protein
VLHVRQQKTGIELAIPVHPMLAAVIAETPTYHLTFLTNQFGPVHGGLLWPMVSRAV